MFRHALCAASVFSLTACSAVQPFTLASTNSSCAPLVVAHAGGNEKYDSDTRKAYRYALQAGARIMETDVRFTSDDDPVIIHDPTVDATTNGSGAVADMPLARLRTLRTSDGQYIPTFYEYLIDAKPYGATYFPELKVDPTAAQWKVFNARVAQSGVPKSKVIINSFDKATLAAARGYGYHTAWIDQLGDRSPADIPPGPVYLKHHWAITAARTKVWNAAGLKVYAWTSDYASDWRRMRADHVTGVITNKPAAYLTWAKSGCK